MSEVSSMIQEKKKKKPCEVSEILTWSFYFVSPLYLITQSVPFLSLIPTHLFSKDKEEEILQKEGK